MNGTICHVYYNDTLLQVFICLYRGLMSFRHAKHAVFIRRLLDIRKRAIPVRIPIIAFCAYHTCMDDVSRPID